VAALGEMEISVEEILASQPGWADFSDLRPKILTIYSAKGLTFDAVVIPRLVRKA
jgi:superfamily I DNA/RNA helicase